MQLQYKTTYIGSSYYLSGLHKFMNYGDQFLITFGRSYNKISLFTITNSGLKLKRSWTGEYGNDPVVEFTQIELNSSNRYEVGVEFKSGKHATIDWSYSYPNYARWKDGLDADFDNKQAWEMIPDSNWSISKIGSTIKVTDISTSYAKSTINLPNAGWSEADLDLDDFFVGKVGGKTYAFGTSSTDNAIASYFIGAQGKVHARDVLDAQDGFYCEFPKVYDLVQMGDMSYLLIGDPIMDRFYVIKVNEWGGMILKSELGDSRNTRFDGCEDIAVVKYDDRCFVVAGGADDGLTLLELTSDGRLHVLDVIADTNEMTLRNVKQIQARVEGEKLIILASSESEIGVSELFVDLDELGVVKEGYQHEGYYTYGDRLYGTSKNDVLLGLDGADHLFGQSGNDRLVDGKGMDHLTGGAGEDRFVFVRDDRWDYIRDFEKGKDIIDLTHMNPVHSFGKLKIEKVSANNWTIKFFEEGIDVTTTDDNITWTADDFMFY